MKKTIIISLFMSFSILVFAQENSVQNIYQKSLYQDTISGTNFKDNLNKLFDSVYSNPYKENRKNINTVANPLTDIIIEMESKTYFNKNISADTRRLISLVKEAYLIVLIDRSLRNAISSNHSRDNNYFFINKILEATSQQMKLLMTYQYPYYSYETRNKKLINFISIRTGNDLFSITQKNEDRSYTGSLLVEIGTNYLNPIRRRPIKSYQTFLFGLDVYTPSFTDTTKFKNPNDFDILDRPHAAFQYIGWSKKAISKNDKLRWSTTLKLGIIGGKLGEKFQSILHQDVSYSLRPKGWDAQIANGGRLGISLETKHEYEFLNLDNSYNKNSIVNLNLSPFFETKLGSYMTNASIGMQLSNKKFNQNNHNFINHRIKQQVKSFTDHFMYNLSFKSTYVVHNTMLEGYGFINTTEKKSDHLTPKSIYYLSYDQVKRLTFNANITFSYTTRYATFFYNWFIFSPETNLGKLNINNPLSKNIDLSKRWHNFAEIGMTFNLH